MVVNGEAAYVLGAQLAPLVKASTVAAAPGTSEGHPTLIA